MPRLRRTPTLRAAAAVAAFALALTGCGSKDSGSPAADRPSPTATGSGPVTASEGPTSSTATTAVPTATPTATSTGSRCPADRIPDGVWAGPIMMDVRGSGGSKGFADSAGKGRLEVRVAGGRVVDGTWNVAWHSVGTADTGEAAATIDLDGRIVGAVRGTARKPVLPGTWSIHGTAKITRPVQAEAPVDETGQDTSTLRITSSGCDEVSGTFLPSFNSKDAAATFSGTATWVGRPRA